ncbi:hypothetical protein GRAN_2545 [Granulicella sibirica]|uniref:Uncharacterized protein n=1 Tax=Granulicella sibirica TaxID=2479048 RepID=A0A4Q0T157_9BACT|nr:hypothetical protein GRAN_2545 [Granulicella sibirica]
MKAAHALWSKMKNKLVSPIIQDRLFASFSGRVSAGAFCSSKVFSMSNATSF